jgi:hypothetical protein
MPDHHAIDDVLANAWKKINTVMDHHSIERRTIDCQDLSTARDLINRARRELHELHEAASAIPDANLLFTGDGGPWQVLSVSSKDGVPWQFELERNGVQVVLTAKSSP